MKIDSDVKRMTPAQLRREVMKLRRACRKELADTCNSRCWINILASLPEGKKLKPLELSKREFLKNCGKYFDRNQ